MIYYSVPVVPWGPQALPTRQYRLLNTFLVLYGGDLTDVGTMCSGTEAPVLSTIALQKAFKRVFGYEWKIVHQFSAEKGAKKREFIKRFSDTVY